MTEESRIFRGNTLVGKGSRGSGSHENTRSLHNYLSKNRNPWLEIRKPLCSFHNERPFASCLPNGKAEGRRKGKFLISLSSEESNSLNNSPRIVTRTHREFKFSSTYIVLVEEIRRMEISAKSFQNIVRDRCCVWSRRIQQRSITISRRKKDKLEEEEEDDGGPCSLVAIRNGIIAALLVSTRVARATTMFLVL